MALAKTDKSDIVLMMGEAIHELILPRFDVIEKDIAVLKNDVSALKEDLEDVKQTVHRIETRQWAEIERVDNHELRISKLEKVIH